MKYLLERMTAVLLCLSLLAGFLLALPPTQAEAKNYGVYEDVAKIYDQGSCPSMQGMSVHGNYVYACKINGDTETSAVVARVHKDTGSTSYLTNASTGTIYFSDFGHGNDIEVETVGGVTTLFVPTSKTGSGSLVRYKISGTTATKVGNYNMVTTSGNSIGGGAIRVMHYDDTNITFLFKSGSTCYTGTLPISQTSGNLVMTYLCSLDYSSCYVNGTYKNTSQYSLQGMGYHDFKLYLPLSGHTVSGHENISIILVYDLEGASGTIKPDSDLTFQITSSYYGAYFEIESCEISPKDGRLYFSTNRRITDSNTNHDGVSYISNWTYTPANRYNGVNNYRWALAGNQFVPYTSGGNAYNGLHQLEGSISDGTFTKCRFVTSKPVVLKHNLPWVVEWSSAGGIGGTMHFATEPEYGRVNAPYIYRRGGSASLLAIGYYDGTYYQDSGIDLADHGLDESIEHVYRLTNKIAADGSNMVYLSVDGKELGPMNNYYVSGYDQGTTTDWLNGRDFSFSYIGSLNYRVHDIKLSYIQVWYNGIYNKTDEPNIYRWESQNNALTSVTDFGVTRNDATKTAGTVSGSSYTNCEFELGRNVVLMHNRPWTIEWQTSGTWSSGTMMLAADHMSNTKYAPYLFRNSSIIAFGQYTGSRHQQWGVCPADYGVTMSDPHTFMLQNRINNDGSNMVYLYVDGEEVAPLNTSCSNGSSTGSTSNGISGIDWVFSYMGTYRHSYNASLEYLQIWESGKPGNEVAQNYRWETVENTLVSQTDKNTMDNPVVAMTGSCTNDVYSNGRYALQRSVVLFHNRNWSVEWQSEGKWTGGGMLLSSAISGYSTNAAYLLRNSNGFSLGQYTGSYHEQWGIDPANHGVDISQAHTYTLINEVEQNGNMVYLYVDGQRLGAMNNTMINGSYSGETSDAISGKDFVFSYIGTTEFPLNDTTLSLLKVSEGCTHSYGNWTVTSAATCTTSGSQSRTCTLCGVKEMQTIAATDHSYKTTVTAPGCVTDGYTTYTCTTCGYSYQGNTTTAIGHSYAGVVTPPTCTNGGYTTYTCSVCGDSYQGDQTEAGNHSYKGTVIEPTCVTDGYTTYRCSTCGDVYQADNIPATGHSYRGVITAPTCIDQGYTTYTCTTCGSSYVGTYTNATGHSYKAVVTAPTCTTGGYTTYTCGGCMHSYRDHITDPIGHSYTTTAVAPTCTTSGYTIYTCNCGKSYTADEVDALGHSYENGTCTSCGEADPDYVTPVVQPTLTLKAPALEFKDMVKVIAFFTAENIDDVVEMGMITYSSKVDEWNVETAENVIPGAMLEESSGRYFASSQGIHAKYLGDTVYLACYAKLTDGSYVYTKLASYSAVQYATSQLKNSTDTNLKQLVVAMLNYGAAAQNYFGYNTDVLANSTLTAEQLALPETYYDGMVSTVPAADATKQGAFSNNKGFSVRKPAVSFEGAFSINYFFTPAYTPMNGITLYYWTEADYNAASVLTAANATGSMAMTAETDGQYRGDITDIAAKNLAQAVYVTAVYSDGTTTWTSGVLGYSIGAYCASQATKGGTIANLAMATAVYGYHAKQYFG